MTKKNMLIDDKTREEVLQATGQPFNELRHSGRTLGNTFYVIGFTMLHPGERVLIADHYSDKYQMKVMMTRLIRDIVHTNKLRFLDIINDGHDLYLVYNIFKGEI